MLEIIANHSSDFQINNGGPKNEPETLKPRRSKDDGNFDTNEGTFYAQRNCFYQSANHVINIQVRKAKQIINVIKFTKIATINPTHKLPSFKLLRIN